MIIKHDEYTTAQDILIENDLEQAYTALKLLYVRFNEYYIGLDELSNNIDKYLPLLEFIDKHLRFNELRYSNTVIKCTPNDKLLELLFGRDKIVTTYIKLMLNSV